MRPRQLGDVDQAVDAVEVHEGAEVDDVRDLALDDEARLQAVEDALAVLAALLLEHGAARQHNVVARAVELDDLALERLPEELVEVRHAADVDQRRGQEAAHAQVDDQAALDDLDHAAGDRLARLLGGLDAPPGALEPGALLGHDEAAVLVLLGEDQRVDLLAQLDLVVRVDGLADGKLVGGDDPLALVADVDKDLVVVDPDDLAGDDVALFEGRDRGVVVGDDLPVDLEQEAVRSFDDLGVRWRFGSGGHESRQGSRYVDSLAMPKRATKRGAERTPIDLEADVLICGASFAGLAVARELAGSGASVLTVDRYEVGERQTSACAAPTAWLRALGLQDSVQQTFGELLCHTPRGDVRWRLPWTFSTFDYRTLCALLFAQTGARFETAKVERRTAGGVLTDRGELRAPNVVDALGWRRVLSNAPEPIQPPEAFLSRGLEVHPDGNGADLELWLDPRYIRAGYSWSFPADHELRVGVGSFDPHDKVKEPTLELARDVDVSPVRFQGNWIPHRIRPAVEGHTFFAGDSAGHCLPVTAEGIRPALYFGLALGRELRAVHLGWQSRERAMRRYARFSDSHVWKYEALYRLQNLVGHVNPRPRLMHAWLRAMKPDAVTRWAFARYLNLAPPDFAQSGPRPRTAAAEPVAA